MPKTSKVNVKKFWEPRQNSYKWLSSQQVVRHIIRIKGFSGEAVRIAYIDFNDHALIKEFSPHSLISCHMDSTLYFSGVGRIRYSII